MQSGASSQWNMTPPPGAYDPQLPSGKNSFFPVRRQAPFGTTAQRQGPSQPGEGPGTYYGMKGLTDDIPVFDSKTMGTSGL